MARIPPPKSFTDHEIEISHSADTQDSYSAMQTSSYPKITSKSTQTTQHKTATQTTQHKTAIKVTVLNTTPSQSYNKLFDPPTTPFVPSLKLRNTNSWSGGHELLTAEEEILLARQIRLLIKWEETREMLELQLGRPPSYKEWATGISSLPDSPATITTKQVSE